MGKKIGVNDLSRAVAELFTDYSEFVSDEMKEVIRQAGKDAAKDLQKKSPRKKGNYAKSWRSKTRNESANTIHVTVYAGDHEYSLTHLLENGHAKRGGGRVPARKHISPVNEEVARKVLQEMERQI